MKVGIVGAGFVGATSAYALVMRGVGREVVLVDRNEKRAQAEADDILHAAPFAHPLQVKAGGYSDLEGSRVVIVAAGVGQKPGESRLELLKRNAAVFQDVIHRILNYAPEAVLLVVSNPVDIMTHLAARYATEYGVPSNRVIGSGTTLDTARFRALLGNYLGVDAHHVHGYVIGEHGDSEVLTWSLVTVGTTPLEQFCILQESFCYRKDKFCLTSIMKEEIDRKVRRAAYSIIEGKGATYYGIGSAVAHIVSVILRDQRAILTVSTPLLNVEGINNVTLSLPQIVGGDGVLATFLPPISIDEKAALKAGAELIRKAIDDLGI
jgi:L-lactate dehydrogenase